MTIGAISFQPYVYNVNAVSPASMNRLSRISDNVLDKKTEYKGVSENENPLKKGQTLDFQGMLEMQMQRGRSNAERIMKPGRDAAQETGVRSESGESADEARNDRMADLRKEAGNVRQTADAEQENGSGVSNFRMRQAIRAYEMFMTA